MILHDLEVTDKWIVSCRGDKNIIDPQRPYAWNIEKERTSSGTVEDVATIFLTNRECPFHCLMCDLWKNTTDRSVPEGAIPAQIELALNNMPSTKNLKLYNSGSFFDKKAIPEKDYEKIASLISSYETVIVESHPAFINEDCLRFRDMIKSDLQIAIGLETVNTEILKKLNKRMVLGDFATSVNFLLEHDIFTQGIYSSSSTFRFGIRRYILGRTFSRFCFQCRGGMLCFNSCKGWKRGNGSAAGKRHLFHA